MADELKEAGEKIASEAKSAVEDVKGEAVEVFQELKASIKGETLSTANTVGGAGYREAVQPEKNSTATASLVLGILSLVLALIGYTAAGLCAVFGLIVAIVGVVLGAKARKISQTGVATAGFVCSIIGIVINGVAIVCVIACAAGVAAAAGAFR